jgi:hypothetical protein
LRRDQRKLPSRRFLPVFAIHVQHFFNRWRTPPPPGDGIASRIEESSKRRQATVYHQLANDACDAGPHTGDILEAFDPAVPVHDGHRDRPMTYGCCGKRVGPNVHRVCAVAFQHLCGVIETACDHSIQQL